jgi:hypothetical protein
MKVAHLPDPHLVIDGDDASLQELTGKALKSSLSQS